MQHMNNKPLDTYPSLIWIGAFISGVVTGLIVRASLKSRSRRRLDDWISAASLSVSPLALGNCSYKMALCVRSDLKMKAGKIGCRN